MTHSAAWRVLTAAALLGSVLIASADRALLQQRDLLQSGRFVALAKGRYLVRPWQLLCWDANNACPDRQRPRWRC